MATTKTFAAYTYAADGGAGPDDGRMICTGSLSECRAATRRELGVQALAPWRKWSGEAEYGDVEAYHASRDIGCGGVAIRRA